LTKKAKRDDEKHPGVQRPDEVQSSERDTTYSMVNESNDHATVVPTMSSRCIAVERLLASG